MHRNVFETILGAVVLLVAGAFFYFFYKTADIRPKTGYVVSAAFTKIDGLQAGSAVRVSGVKVGQVLDFSLNDNYQAVVRMNINSGVKLPTDTAAVIASEGLLGGKFMSLEPGADEENLKYGDKIAYTQATPSLEEMLGKFIFSMADDNKKKK
jgi:phospholipid/cholesterol/gamma-HCH transport system substrate-binding protein